MTDAASEESWSRLLDSEESRDERVLQAFLEANPSYLPGARTLDGNSGHDPWPHAVVSQPPLPGLSTRLPDFMWIASDSVFLYPILIEIETPWKRWFQDRKLVQHSDLTVALSQIAQWRSWFANGHNQVAFYEYYRIPRDLQDLTMSPRYVVVHGRRREANASPASQRFRGNLGIKEDTRLLTFDRLHSDPRARDYFTVSLDEHGYKLHPRSPSVSTLELPENVRYEVAGVSLDEDTESRPGYRFRPPRPHKKTSPQEG